MRRDPRETATPVPTVILPTDVNAWPAASHFDRSQRVIRTAYKTTSRFLDLRVEPSLYKTTERPG